MAVVDEQTDNDGDGWIDTRAGRIEYGGEDDTESTYFSDRPVQGQKRKKAPFFKYSKKKKGYGNTSSNSKGSVVSHFKILISFDIHLFITHFLIFALVLWCECRRGYVTNKSRSSSAAGQGDRGSGEGPASRRPGFLSLPTPQTNQRTFLKPSFSSYA